MFAESVFQIVEALAAYTVTVAQAEDAHAFHPMRTQQFVSDLKEVVGIKELGVLAKQLFLDALGLRVEEPCDLESTALGCCSVCHSAEGAMVAQKCLSVYAALTNPNTKPLPNNQGQTGQQYM